MPSKLKQVNVRVDQETLDRIERLKPMVKEALGVEISVADLFRLGMADLEKRFSRPSAALEKFNAEARPVSQEETAAMKAAKKTKRK